MKAEAEALKKEQEEKEAAMKEQMALLEAANLERQ